MTRIFAILVGLLTLAACEAGGPYAGTSDSTYGSNSGGSGSY
jgi:hypothetical protein